MTYDDWKTTEPPSDDDPRDYCPECQHVWAKCKCEPEDEEDISYIQDVRAGVNR
jgi:hypothetical protein